MSWKISVLDVTENTQITFLKDSLQMDTLNFFSVFIFAKERKK